MEDPEILSDHHYPEEELVDFAASLATMQGNEELLKRIANIYLEDYQKQVSKLEEAVREEDGDELEQAAHKIKGSLSNICAPPARELAAELETEGADDDWNEVMPRCKKLTGMLQQVAAELQSWLQKNRG